MLRIGLSGVQGAGKSLLAADIKSALEKTGKYKSIKIIDDYIPEIEKETDLALGFFGTYIGNIYAALGRATREREAIKDNDVVITCGTIFETASYMAKQLEGEFRLLTSDEEKAEHMRRAEASMKFISCLYVDTVKYDHILHLPRIMEIKDGPEADILELDKALVVAFDSFTFFPTVRVHTEGDDLKEISENRIKKVLEVIGENKS